MNNSNIKSRYSLMRARFACVLTHFADKHSPTGMFKNTRDMVALLNPRNLDVYRALLPCTFKMPKTPLVDIFVTSILHTSMSEFNECGIALRCLCNGTEGWFPLIWFVDHYYPMIAGRIIGYPKKKADRITFNSNNGHHRSEIWYHKRPSLSIELTESKINKTTSIHSWIKNETDRSLDLPIFLQLPPLYGPEVISVSHIHKISPKYPIQIGKMDIRIHPDDPLSMLLPNEIATIGRFQRFEGGVNLGIQRMGRSKFKNENKIMMYRNY